MIEEIWGEKMKHMRLLIIIFAILFSCSTYNISANENTDDIVEEKIDVSETLMKRLEMNRKIRINF